VGDDLDYMHARHYNPLTGRFVSTDRVLGSPKRPQTWNRYSYSRNNPLTFVDPDGNCAVPAGLQAGQVGVCIQSFIAADSIGVIGHGDGRDFAANDPNASFRTSYQMIMDPKSGAILSESRRAAISKAGVGPLVVGSPGKIEVQGGVAPTDGGSHYVSLFIKGTNGFEVLANLGSINILANLAVSPNGKVTVDPSSRTKGFPSIEGYAYRMIQGELVIQILFKVPEQDPSKLKQPMDVPLVRGPL
jgi:RHS repeat-associated protein